MADTDIDRNLLFAVIAFQDDLIDQDRFVDVCAGWAADAPPAGRSAPRTWLDQTGPPTRTRGTFSLSH